MEMEQVIFFPESLVLIVTYLVSDLVFLLM